MRAAEVAGSLSHTHSQIGCSPLLVHHTESQFIECAWTVWVITKSVDVTSEAITLVHRCPNASAMYCHCGIECDSTRYCTHIVVEGHEKVRPYGPPIFCVFSVSGVLSSHAQIMPFSQIEQASLGGSGLTHPTMVKKHVQCCTTVIL